MSASMAKMLDPWAAAADSQLPCAGPHWVKCSTPYPNTRTKPEMRMAHVSVG